MQFPASLGFNVQTADPFANDRFYARLATGADEGLQSFTIHDALGEPIAATTIPDHLGFDATVAELRRITVAARAAS